MSFSFTIPYITFLGLTLLIIIGITIFLVRRMNNQNQKFSSIVGVVTSLAEELNSIKMCISNSINNISSDTKIINTDLIAVSDDDDDDEEDDDDDDDDDEEDDDEEEEEKDDEEEEEKDDEEEEENDMTNTNDFNEECNVININDTVKYIHLENSNNSHQDKDDIFEMLPEEIISTDPLPLEEQEYIIQGSIEETQPEDLITDINIVKKEIIDYKKMSLTKLRTIVLEKGLSDNISKLKKNELLQILESNLQN